MELFKTTSLRKFLLPLNWTAFPAYWQWWGVFPSLNVSLYSTSQSNFFYFPPKVWCNRPLRWAICTFPFVIRRDNKNQMNFIQIKAVFLALVTQGFKDDETAGQLLYPTVNPFHATSFDYGFKKISMNVRVVPRIRLQVTGTIFHRPSLT